MLIKIPQMDGMGSDPERKNGIGQASFWLLDLWE
jgi:hypothetical protein